MFVFVYGSLLWPASLRSTLPSARLDACVPALCRGVVRDFDVAFPNDGTQRDKSYMDAGWRRPRTVLFANLKHHPRRATNGLCVPVDEHDLRRLRRRELRYDLQELTGTVTPYEGCGTVDRPVVAFLGKPAFTDPDRVPGGVVPMAYLRLIESGARHWSGRCPGFLSDYHASTRPPRRTESLLRIDHLEEVVPSAGSLG